MVKEPTDKNRVNRFMQKYKKTVGDLKVQQKTGVQSKKNRILNTHDDHDINMFTNKGFASGMPVAAKPTSKDRYSKYKVRQARKKHCNTSCVVSVVFVEP